MGHELFFKDELLPFVEARYSKSHVDFKPHIHSSFSIGAVDKGEVMYSVAGEQELLSPGMLAIINPESLHSCNTLHGKDRSYYMLYLHKAWCAKVQESLWGTSTFQFSTTIKIEDAIIYHNYCMVMKELFSSQVHLQEKEQLLFELVSQIFNSVSHQQTIEVIVHCEDMERLKELLRKDLQSDLPLETIASDFHINPYTLLRHFKENSGITPHAYRMNCRIEKAKQLLQQGVSIADTAFECGFFDQSHLHRHFKALTATTPKKYKVNFMQ